MKIYAVIAVAVLLTVGFLSANLMEPVNLSDGTENESVQTETNLNRDFVPNYEFYVEPLTIMQTWYDYFPGTYNSTPLRVQSTPSGMWDGGGIYIAFQAILSAGGMRRAYYAYIDNGEITSGPSLINVNGTQNEGFPAIDIDQDTGDPFVSWHTLSAADPLFSVCPLTYDQYSMMGFPGLWNVPYAVIDNPYTINGEEGQEFMWPNVFIGPSPNPGQKRLFIIADNVTANVNDLPCPNSLIAFADYTESEDLENYDEDQWTYITIPQLNDWRQLNIRTFSAPIVCRETGKIAIAGHTQKLATDDPYDEDNFLFVLENDNYGEGDWTLFTGDPTIPVDNPDDYYVDGDGVPYQDMRYKIHVNRHDTVIDDQGNYHFVGIFPLFAEDNTWFPILTTTKHIKFYRATGEFVIRDLYPRHEDGESLYLPWSIPPEYDADGNLIVNYSWPCHSPSPDDIFHENYHRLIQKGNKMIALFQSSYLSDYWPAPDTLRTHIMLSDDYGETWSEPILLDSADTPELAGLNPIYWYMADHMEQLFGNWYRIHLLFYSPFDYPNTAGELMYTSLDIDFWLPIPPGVDEEPLAAYPANMLQQNYPNPFNPQTTIGYYLPADMEVTLEIFNIKGQLVKTLAEGYRPAGENYAVWSGRDNDNSPVGSGIYLYRLSTEQQTETRKMLFIK